MDDRLSDPIRILIVEDRATDYDLARYEIDKVLPGCEFALASTRKDFLAALETLQPSVILSDYDLPRFDGITALRLTRERAPLTPFIIWTGARSEDVAVECMKAGANNYVLKDNIKRLGPAVLHALGERDMMVQRAQAEQALVASQTRFRKLIESSSDVIAVIGPEADLRYVSESVLRNYGYGVDELIGRNAFEFIHPEDEEFVAGRLLEALQNPGMPISVEFRLRHKDGSWRWTEAVGRSQLDDPDIQGLLVNYREITERKQAQAAQLRNEERLRQIIDLVPHLIFAKDADGRFILVNQATADIFGTTVEGLTGSLEADFVRYEEELRDFHSSDLDVISSNRPRTTLGHRVTDSTGRVRLLNTTKIPFTFSGMSSPAVLGVSVDVTELREFEEKYRAIFENSSIGIYQSTVEGKFLTVNAAFARMLGYESPEDMVSSITDIGDQIHYDPVDRQRFAQALAENGQVTNFVYRMHCKAEGVLWVSESARAVHDRNGNIQYYEGTVEDITERKRAGDELSRITAELQDLVQASPVGIITYDLEGRVRTWNPATRRITGYEAGEVVGQRGVHLRADELAEFDAIRERTLKGQAVLGYEVERHRKDGSRIFLSLSTGATKDASGEVTGWMAIVEDITDRRMAREWLRTAERKYRDLVEQLPIAIYTDYGDETGTKKYLSPQFETITGYPVQEWLEHPDFWPAVIHPDDRQRVLSENVRTNESREPFNAEYRLQKADGTHAWVREEAVYIADEHGGPGTWQGYLLDISERKRAALETQALLDIMGGQAATHSLDDYLRLIHRCVAEVIFAENFFVVLHNQETGLFEEIYSIDKYDPPSPPALLERSLSAYVFRTGEPLLVGSSGRFEELATSGEVELVGTDSASWLGVPLTAAGRVIGVMAVQDYEGRDRYSAHDGEFLSSIATQVALAIERKQAEMELQRSRTVLAQAEAMAHLGAWDADIIRGDATDAEVLRWSDEVFRILGYEPGGVVPTEAFFRGHIVPEDRPMVTAAAEQSLSEGRPYEIEFQILRRDGSRRFIHEQAETFSGEGGSAKRMIGAIQDITERKQADAVAQRHLAELEALYENGLALSSLLDPADIGDRLIQTFEDYLSWHHVAIRLRRPGTDELETVACNQPGLDDKERAGLLERLNSVVSRVGQGLSGWVAQTGQPLTAADVHDFPQYVATFPGIRSGLYVPLKVGEEVIGCISVESEEPAEFDVEDERLLGTLANQAAIAFENARLYRDVRRQNRMLLALQQATVPLLGQRDLGDVLESIIAQASNMLGASNGYIYLVDPDAHRMSVAVGTGVFSRAVGAHMGFGEGLAGRVWESARPVNIDDYHTWAGRSPSYDDIEFHAVVGVPLISDGIVRGVLGLAHTSPDERFTNEDVEIVDRFAQLAAIAYENTHLAVAAQRELEQRFRTEAALRASEAQYRHLFEHMLNGFAYCQMITEDGRPQDFVYLRVNDAFQTLTGLQDVVGRRVTEVLPDIKEQTPEIFEIYNRVANSGWPERFEINFAPLDKWLDIAVYSPQPGYFVALFDDITGRKRSEATLRERLALMEYAAGHTLPDLLQKSLVDLGGLTASPLGFFHFVDEQQQGLTLQAWSSPTLDESGRVEELELHYPVHKAGVWADALRERRPVVFNDYLDGSKNTGLPVGRAPLTRLMVMPVLRNDRVVALVGMGNKSGEYTAGDVEIAARFADYAWDIAERKGMEMSLAEERNLLAERVEERTSQLSLANAELARANRLKDEFLATMSHELRTPLNAILSLSESLLEGIYGPLNPEQSSTLQTVEESGHHLLELINDILDVSKIEAGKLNLSIHPVESEPICQAALRLVRQQALSKRLRLNFNRDPSAHMVQADDRRLKQMLVNLLSNAVKFTPEDGEVGLDVTSEADGEVIRFTVWDNGPGVPPEQLNLLFQPFVQLDSSLSRRYTGTGLGLALVRRLAELHGGGAGVETEPGKGSRFFFALPAAPMKDQSAEVGAMLDEMEPQLGFSARDACLLICDDNPVNLKAVSEYLVAFGFRVVTAVNGLEALERAAESRPDLILMDIQMPELDGLEATRRIRANPEFAAVPIIAVTALAMPGDRERCLAAGANEFIAKPLSHRVLRAKIRELMESD